VREQGDKRSGQTVAAPDGISAATALAPKTSSTRKH
jgi:hypothetical protein